MGDLHVGSAVKPCLEVVRRGAEDPPTLFCVRGPLTAGFLCAGCSKPADIPNGGVRAPSVKRATAAYLSAMGCAQRED